MQHPVLNTSTRPRITSSHAWPRPAAKPEVKERAQRALGPGCILRSQKQGKVLQSEGLAHEYGDPGSGRAQNQIHLWCVCPAGPRPQCYQHLQRCGLRAPARGFQTYQKHKLSLNSFKNIQDPKKGFGGKRNFKKGRTSEIKYFYIKKAYMQNIYTHTYIHICIHIYLHKTMKRHMNE